MPSSGNAHEIEQSFQQANGRHSPHLWPFDRFCQKLSREFLTWETNDHMRIMPALGPVVRGTVQKQQNTLCIVSLMTPITDLVQMRTRAPWEPPEGMIRKINMKVILTREKERGEWYACDFKEN